MSVAFLQKIYNHLRPPCREMAIHSNYPTASLALNMA